MAGVSNITVTDLAAVPTSAGSIAVAWKWGAPAGQGGLSYLQPKEFKVYVGATATFGSATLATTIPGPPHVQGGIPPATNRYFWIVAVDKGGNESAVFGPVMGTTSADAGRDFVANPIQTNELGNNVVTAGKINVSSLSAISANIGNVTAGSITGVTITGATIQTATSGARVVMNTAGYSNSLALLDSSGSPRVALQGSGTALIVNSAASAANFAGSATSGSTGILTVSNNSAGVAILGASQSNGSNGHGLRGQGGGGGSGLVGVSGVSGGHAFYTQTGGYGSFTGVHDAFIRKGKDWAPGDIAVIVRVIGKGPTGSYDDVVPEVQISTTAMQKAAYGVISRVSEFEADSELTGLPMNADGSTTPVRRLMAQEYMRTAVNAIGEGLMNVCGEGGNILKGDYICASNTPGKGMRQVVSLLGLNLTADDTMKSYTIAKAMEDVTFASASEIKTIAVTYHCG